MFRLLDPAGTPRLPARRRFAGTVAALGFLALLAGAALLDENRSRLLRMTPEARHELHEHLVRIDADRVVEIDGDVVGLALQRREILRRLGLDLLGLDADLAELVEHEDAERFPWLP